MALRLLVTALLWALWQDPAASAARDEPKYLITFGESWTTTSWNMDEEQPSVENPIGNPAFPGRTSSSGPNWVTTLTAEVNTSLTLTYNFAYPGATIDRDIVAPHHARMKCFSDQVDRFLKHLAPKPEFAPWTADNALVGVWIGMTDVGIHCECFPEGTMCDNGVKIYKRSVKRYFELLDVMYWAGIRKFLLMTPPPVEMTPKAAVYARPRKRAVYLAHMQYYRGLLTAEYQKFKASHPDIKVRLIDPYPAFAEAYNNPQKYGAPNVTCEHDDGVSCLWKNQFHPGIAIHKLLAWHLAPIVNGEYYDWR